MIESPPLPKMPGAHSPQAPSVERAGDVHAGLQAYQEQIRPLLREAIPDREPRKHLYDLLGEQLSRSGKCVRPALCIATCRAFGGTGEDALPSAAAIELLHNAFLVHDDIEDGSEFRRDRPTVHRRSGVPLAINAGDAMNALSLSILKKNLPVLGPELSWRILGEFDHMLIETLEGQAMELGWIRDNDCDTTEEDYLLMVLKKTCWYSFIHPCRIGALAARREDVDPEGFDRFGYYLGTAFQIQDDVLNLVGDRNKYGKEIGGDILEGKRTLLLAHLFKTCDPENKRRLRAFFAKPRSERATREAAFVMQLLRSCGSIDYGRAVARQFAAAARDEFDRAYAGAPPSSDLEFLRSLVDYMITRQA
ncbi:MAG TPA: polyprenyl synthetase family protein [Polyangiaceae bacterium]|jgi:geranylgeranyl diphosphate synthase type II|nr:polyprenyl synthetase family protein [Polyangiaceae bacterium]